MCKTKKYNTAQNTLALSALPICDERTNALEHFRAHDKMRFISDSQVTVLQSKNIKLHKTFFSEEGNY